MSSTPFDDDPLNGPNPTVPSAPAAPSAADSMSDPLNGGPSNWGSAEAMEDNAYLYDEIEVKVGPMALLEGAMSVITTKPGALLLIGLISGGAWYGAQKTVGAGLVDIAQPIVGDEGALAASQIVVMLLVWSVGLLLQGPLLGVALQSKTQQDGLLKKYGNRAFESFKTLAGVAGLNLLVCVVAMFGWAAAVYVLGLVGGMIGGLVGGLILVLGSVGAMFPAMSLVMRYAIAAPAVLAEKLPAISAMKRSAELTRGTSLAMAFALMLPIILWIMATIGLSLFGLLNNSVVSLVWVAGFYVFYMMLSLAFVPSAYLVYRHMVDGTRPDVVAQD